MSSKADISKELQVNLLETMYKIRLFEQRTKKLFKQNYIFGALHLYIGEEAIATGACATLSKDDYVVSTHRGHGHTIAKGAELKYMLAELMGRKTGYSGGHGGSMHIFCKELGLLGGNGIVGAGIPIALGAAYSCKYRKSTQVAVCFFGDGAANQGTFHESMNMAALWKLPVIYICENNCFAATTSSYITFPTRDIAPRAAGYDVPYAVIDGNDVEAVYTCVSQAVDRARSGQGPTLIECKTYRIEDHCMVLHQEKDVEELKRWQQRDPIATFEQKLLARNVITDSQINQIKQRIEQELNGAEEFAANSPWPGIEELHNNFYA